MRYVKLTTKLKIKQFSCSSKIENKNPQPSSGNILENHKRPSSSTSPEISPDVAALILSQKRPIKPTKTETEVKPETMFQNPLPSMSSQKQVFGLNFPNFFEPQRAPPAIASYEPMNAPIQVINDRFYSPIYESKVEENAAFFQNSKLHKFFHSPHYIQNIYGKFITDSENDSHDENLDVMPVIVEEPVAELANPLTKEAIWYKDYVNKKRVRNANNIFMRDY